MLRTITPRIDDPLAGQWAKGVARILRYLQSIDANGGADAASELDELAVAPYYQNNFDITTPTVAARPALTRSRVRKRTAAPSPAPTS